MKVLVIHDDANESGGANQFRKDLSALLEQEGVEIFLFTYRAGTNDDPMRSFVYQYNDRVRYIRHLSKNYFNPRLFFSLRRFIARVRPDVIHIHQNDRFTTSVLSACMGPVPVVQTVHDHRTICPLGKGITPDGSVCTKAFGMRWYRHGCLSLRECSVELLPKVLKTFLMRKAVDTFLVPSTDLKAKMEDYGFRVSLLRHYVDTSRYPIIEPDPESNRILFVGRMNEGKGVDVLLDAFKQLQELTPGATLDLVGDDETGGSYQRLTRDLGVEDRVQFHGVVAHERMPAFYAGANLLVLPARWIENSPLVILEAMAACRPVMAGRIGGIPEIVVDGESGVLCTPGDVRDLREKMAYLLSNKEKAKRMGVRGREIVEQNHSVQRHLDAYFKIIRGISGSCFPEPDKPDSGERDSSRETFSAENGDRQR